MVRSARLNISCVQNLNFLPSDSFVVDPPAGLNFQNLGYYSKNNTSPNNPQRHNSNNSGPSSPVGGQGVAAGAAELAAALANHTGETNGYRLVVPEIINHRFSIITPVHVDRVLSNSRESGGGGGHSRSHHNSRKMRSSVVRSRLSHHGSGNNWSHVKVKRIKFDQRTCIPGQFNCFMFLG